MAEGLRVGLKHRGLSIRQVHQGGEKCFVDYAGKKPSIIDIATCEVIEVEFFVTVLGKRRTTPTPKPRAPSRSPTGSRSRSVGRCPPTR